MDCNLKCINYLKELCVYKVLLFSALQHENFEEITGRMIYRKYREGEIILAQDSKPHGTTIIRKGSTKACRITPDGQEKILYLFSKNDFFGEQYLLGDERASHHIVALQKVEICSLSWEHFQYMIFSRPPLAQQCIEEPGRRVIMLEQVVQNAGTQKVGSCIAPLPLGFDRKYGVMAEQGPSVSLPLSREGIANYLGIARETLSRKLNQLEEDGMIRFVGSKRITLLQPQILAAMASGETAISPA